MIKGECLCHSIKFEAEEIPGMVFNCHCNRCRSAHGSSFSTQVLANPNIKFIQGEEYLSEHVFEGMVRGFCSKCGSRLLNYDQNRTYLSVSIGAIKENKNFMPVGECYIGEKLGFIQLNDKVSHFEKLPISPL
jgi:hypothetical protein